MNPKYAGQVIMRDGLPDSAFFKAWRRGTITFPAKVRFGCNDRVWCADGSVWRIKEKRGGKWTRRRVKTS